eukprot:3075788-Pyramimonas_sp.AAC.1
MSTVMCFGSLEDDVYKSLEVGSTPHMLYISTKRFDYGSIAHVAISVKTSSEVQQSHGFTHIEDVPRISGSSFS